MTEEEKQTPPRTPVTIYVVHHPDSNDAKKLAGGLFDWFRLSEMNGDSCEAGLPLYFRRKVDKKKQEIVPAINFEESRLNVLIFLVDYHLVGDASWRVAIDDVVRQINNETDTWRAIALPISLDESAARCGSLFSKFGSFSIRHETNINQKKSAVRCAATEFVARALRSVRDLETPLGDEGAPPPLQVFLSHAKADGREIAECIRDGVRKVSQLTAWYDASDLAYGRPWEGPMKQAAESGTAALIATITDRYPTRPWCRAEAALARTPRQVDGDPNCRIWRVQPAVAVHAPGPEWTRSVPMLDGVPRVGWERLHPDDRTACVVDRLVLEVLLSLVHQAIAEDHLAERKVAGEPDASCYITWVPDTWTLASLRDQMNEKGMLTPELNRIVYPGYGLSLVEQDELRPVVKSFGDRVALMSFEEVFE